MKLPLKPPDYISIFKKMVVDDKSEKLFDNKLFNFKEYYHWDKLKYLKPPNGFSNEEWWAAIKLHRQNRQKKLSLLDNNSTPFSFLIPDSVLRDLHWLDQHAAGAIKSDPLITTAETRNTYIVKSLIDEAISSSQLEGASTTIPVAKEMIRQKREPKNKHEQMILNNYYAMEFIREVKNEKLTAEIIKELHRLLTQKTLEDDTKAGNYRTVSDDVVIIDPNDGVILHFPSNPKEILSRVEILCDFANDSNEEEFVHPVIRAIILHFMLAYIHPFVDGNGRTARALFYWAMANQKYWLIEFISISRIIKRAPIKYGKAFLYTESDENDLTYFILHQLAVVKDAISDLFKYLDKKTKQLHDAERLLSSNKKLNFRQLTLLRHALKHPRFNYTISEYMQTHGIVYETARKDLMQMSDQFNLLIKAKMGKKILFISPHDLHDRLKTNK